MNFVGNIPVGIKFNRTLGEDSSPPFLLLILMKLEIRESILTGCLGVSALHDPGVGEILGSGH